MAKRVSQLPSGGREKFYPWDEWMDGSVWQIHRGDDFVCTFDSMAVYLRQRAYTHGYRASLRLNREEETITFQFTKKPPKHIRKRQA